MRKVRFLQDFESFRKDTYRVIMSEENGYYNIQIDLHGRDMFGISKQLIGDIYQVVERS